MEFLLILTQEGDGCDYMIDCGTQVIAIEAPNEDEAWAKAIEVITGDEDECGYTGDIQLKKAILTTRVRTLDLPSIYKKMGEEEMARIKREKDVEEEKLYLELKKKFE